MAERVGTVFIAADPDADGVMVLFHGYWDGGDSVLEQMPVTPTGGAWHPELCSLLSSGAGLRLLHRAR